MEKIDTQTPQNNLNPQTITPAYINDLAYLPASVKADLSLSLSDKTAYLHINNLSLKYGYCFISNEKLLKKLPTVNDTTVLSRMLTKLEQHGHIIKHGKNASRKIFINYANIEIGMRSEIDRIHKENEATAKLLQEFEDAIETKAALQAKLRTLSQMPLESGYSTPQSQSEINAKSTLYNEVILNNITSNNNNNEKQPLSSCDSPSSFSLSSSADTPPSADEQPFKTECEALSQAFPQLTLSPMALEKAMSVFNLTLVMLNHILRDTSDALLANKIEKTPKAYFYGLCKKAKVGEYDVDTYEKPAQETPHATKPEQATDDTPLAEKIECNEPDSVCVKMKERLEKQINRPSFNTWIRPIKLESMNAKQAVFLVPDDTFTYWLNEYYSMVIANALASITGLKPDIVFLVREA